MKLRVSDRMFMARRLLLLKLRGRVRHNDNYGLSYWIWKNNRAMSTHAGHARTDDFGVLEQLRKAYRVLGSEPERDFVSIDVGAYIGVMSLAMVQTPWVRAAIL